MPTTEEQVAKWLEEISVNGSDEEDNLLEEFDSDDSVEDPNYVADYEDDLENILVTTPDDANIQSTSSPIQEAITTGTGQQRKQLDCEHLIINPSKSTIRGKNKYIWNSEPSSSNKISNRTPSRNIVHIIPGSKDEARHLIEPLECFEKFFTSHLMDEVLIRTNEDIELKASKYKIQSSTVSQTGKEELRALLGLLVLSGALKNNHLSSKELFDPSICGSQNIAAMSCERFEFLIKCLHFDDRSTREERKKTDKFAPIRNIWEIFIKQCRELYKPGSYVTIDEQLLAFKGRCPFRMYIPNKPAKYGIKIVLVCDVRTKYMFDACPYLGKNGDTTIKEPLGSYYCKLLTKTIHGTNRNLTADNWFTSVPLAEQLLERPYNLTFIGTIRNNKQEIPVEFKHNLSRLVGTSIFGFNDKLTLVSYKPKPQKTVLLISTMHDKPSVDPVSGKPLIVLSYNETKGAVDTFDQMYGHTSCSRKTRRWPLCMFYGMLNMAMLNSFIIYVSNCEVLKLKSMSRRDFLKKLSKYLCSNWCSTRLEERPTLKKRVRAAIHHTVGTLKNQEDSTGEPPIKRGKRSMCEFCPPKLKRMSVHYCAKCEKTYCMEHRSPNCIQCDKK
jgi:hypothetical protein